MLNKVMIILVLFFCLLLTGCKHYTICGFELNFGATLDTGQNQGNPYDDSLAKAEHYNNDGYAYH